MCVMARCDRPLRSLLIQNPCARICSGHPRLAAARKTWMAGTSPAKGRRAQAAPDRVSAVDLPERVLVARAPALVAGFRQVIWLPPEVESETLSPAQEP